MQKSGLDPDPQNLLIQRAARVCLALSVAIPAGAFVLRVGYETWESGASSPVLAGILGTGIASQTDPIVTGSVNPAAASVPAMLAGPPPAIPVQSEAVALPPPVTEADLHPPVPQGGDATAAAPALQPDMAAGNSFSGFELRLPGAAPSGDGH